MWSTFLLLLGLVLPVAVYSQPFASPATQIRYLLNSWNNANNAHDTITLARLYAAELYYYGPTKDRGTALKDKAQFFGSHPDFRQRISDVHIRHDTTTGPAYYISFRKIVSEGGRRRTYNAYLWVDSVGETIEDKLTRPRIVVEGDETTDRNLVRMLKEIDPYKFGSCEDVVWAIFRSAPEVRKKFSSTLNVDVDHVDTTGAETLHMYYYPPFGGFTRTIGWYTFHPNTTQLTDDIFERRVTYDRRLLKYFRRFCK